MKATVGYKVVLHKTEAVYYTATANEAYELSEFFVELKLDHHITDIRKDNDGPVVRAIEF